MAAKPPKKPRRPVTDEIEYEPVEDDPIVETDASPPAVGDDEEGGDYAAALNAERGLADDGGLFDDGPEGEDDEEFDLRGALNGASGLDLFETPSPRAPSATPARRSEPPSLWAMARMKPNVSQLRVFRVENGREIEIGECDSKIDSPGFIQRFLDQMPQAHDPPREFVAYPLMNGRQDIERIVIGPYDAQHLTIRALREAQTRRMSPAQMDATMASIRASTPAGSDMAPVIQAMREQSTEMSRLFQTLIAQADRREADRERREAEERRIREQREAEERKARREEDERIARQRLEIATSSTRAVETMAERLMENERVANERRTESLAKTYELQAKTTETTGQSQVAFLTAMFAQQQATALQALERERIAADERARRERDDYERREKEREREMERREKEREEERRERARREEEDRKDREREREERARLREEAERQRYEREKEERQREWQERQDRQRREDEFRQRQEEKLAAIERERIAAARQDSPAGFLTQATALLGMVGINPKDLIGRLINPPDDGDDGPGLAEVLPVAMEQGGKLLGTLVTAATDYAKSKDANATKREETRILAARAALPPPPPPTPPMIPSYPPQGYNVAPGTPPMMVPAPPGAPVPPGQPVPAGETQPPPYPAPPAAPAQPAPMYPGDIPAAPASNLPAGVQRDARRALARLIEQLARSEDENNWPVMIQQAISDERALIPFFKDLTVRGAMIDANAPPVLIDRVLQHPALIAMSPMLMAEGIRLA